MSKKQQIESLAAQIRLKRDTTSSAEHIAAALQGVAYFKGIPLYKLTDEQCLQWASDIINAK